jgi:predicted HAD superfamily Cof-like phosphohydrolase
MRTTINHGTTQAKPKVQNPDLFNDVKDFHKKFGIGYDGPPRALPLELRAFRKMRLEAEMLEYLTAYQEDDPEGQLDGIVDLIYIALGTMDLHGWDFYEAWKRVHAANMKKEKASDKNPGHFGHKNDIVKPPGWEAPDLSDLVKGCMVCELKGNRADGQ